MVKLFDIQQQHIQRNVNTDTLTTDDQTTPETYCGAGASTLAIDPVGNVYPCVQWRQPIGNIHSNTLSSVWFDNPALSEIRQANRQARTKMEEQSDKVINGAFCPGVAALNQGNPTSIYPEVYLRSKLHTSIIEKRNIEKWGQNHERFR